MSKVYILVDNPRSNINFLPAEKYGELCVLFDNNISSTHIQRIFPELKLKLSRIEKDDYLIPTGHPALIALAGHVWLDKLGVINILSWDMETNQYYNVRALR